MAAAFFNAEAPPGWSATTAGIEPQAQVGVHAPRLLAGTPAEAHLDGLPPRPLAEVPQPDLVVTIDCGLPGSQRWDLDHEQFDGTMREEIRQRVAGLVLGIADS